MLFFAMAVRGLGWKDHSFGTDWIAPAFEDRHKW